MRARRSERGARELLGVEAVRRALRRVATLRKRARQRLGREFVAESALVGERAAARCRARVCGRRPGFHRCSGSPITISPAAVNVHRDAGESASRLDRSGQGASVVDGELGEMVRAHEPRAVRAQQPRAAKGQRQPDVRARVHVSPHIIAAPNRRASRTRVALRRTGTRAPTRRRSPSSGPSDVPRGRERIVVPWRRASAHPIVDPCTSSTPSRQSPA